MELPPPDIPNSSNAETLLLSRPWLRWWMRWTRRLQRLTGGGDDDGSGDDYDNNSVPATALCNLKGVCRVTTQFVLDNYIRNNVCNKLNFWIICIISVVIGNKPDKDWVYGLHGIVSKTIERVSFMSRWTQLKAAVPFCKKIQDVHGFMDTQRCTQVFNIYWVSVWTFWVVPMQPDFWPQLQRSYCHSGLRLRPQVFVSVLL